MRRRRKQSGLTLVELIVAFTIMLILTSMAVPLARAKVRAERERALRYALDDMRLAIDKYKDASDNRLIQPGKIDSEGYPESLQQLVDGVLIIRRAKFGKTRLIPLHPTTTRALERYAQQRDKILGQQGAPAFFVSDAGRRITEWSARYQFAQLSQRLGHRPSNRNLARRHRYRHGRGPRLHDLRHRFAALTLLDWYRAGVDVEREIQKLVTYLGHVKIEQTYWYIEAVPELLQLATKRVATGWKVEAAT